MSLDRFFLATTLGDACIQTVSQIGDQGEPPVCIWWPEDHLDLVPSTTRERKVRTIEELEAAIKEPMKVAPTRNIWIHDSLVDEARQLWESERGDAD